MSMTYTVAMPTSFDASSVASHTGVLPSSSVVMRTIGRQRARSVRLGMKSRFSVSASRYISSTLTRDAPILTSSFPLARISRTTRGTDGSGLRWYPKKPFTA